MPVAAAAVVPVTERMMRPYVWPSHWRHSIHLQCAATIA